MKKILLTILTVLLFFSSYSQCTPNPIFLASPIPGVYPPNIPIPNIPLVGISDGQQGVQYNEILTLVVLEDTTLDIGFLLPQAVVSAMNLAGVSTTMTVDVNHVIFDVQGLPNGLDWLCDQNITNMCMYNSGVDGCIAISGTPIQAGNFSVPVSMTIQIQIPSIPNPLPGMPAIFGGMSADLPAFNAIEYDLFIDGGSSVFDKSLESTVYPNPITSSFILTFDSKSDIIIYDIFGKKINHYKNIKSPLTINSADVGKGIFYVTFYAENNTQTQKIIIK